MNGMNQQKTILLVAWVVGFTIGRPGASAGDQPDQPAAAGTALVSYWRDVRPILQMHCQGCHQPAKSGGEYVMTQFERLLRGGESGQAAIVPGKPEESYLVEQITPVDGQAPMPKEKPPLSEREIELITRWIVQEAKDDTPASAHPRYDNEHPPRYAAAPVVTSLDFSAGGELVAASGYHEVLLHRLDASRDPPAELVARLVGMSERIEAAEFSPDGKRIAVAGGSPGRLGELQIWDVESRSMLLSVPISYDTCYGASWSPDGKLVSIGCPDNSIRAFDIESGKQVLFNGAHNDWVLDTVFSKDGSHLVSVSRDRSMKLFVVSEDRFVDNITSITPGALKGGLLAVDRHPEKDELAVGADDGVPKIFRMFREKKRQIGDDYNLIRSFDPIPGRVFDVAFSADGSRLVAASSYNGTGEVRLYDVENGKTIATMEGITGGIYAAAISPDGRVVLSGGFDGVVFVHEATSGKQLGQFVPVPLGRQAVAAGG
jgi:WD40 repeat protein